MPVKIMVVLSALYGVGWAIIGMVDAEGLHTPMLIAGVIFGLLWVVVAMFARSDEASS
ncbi:hypothetical protein [Stackebrandtia albiflava]|nr:hypothetical protein [Stackebrandtia albiflava]